MKKKKLKEIRQNLRKTVVAESDHSPKAEKGNYRIWRHENIFFFPDSSFIV